MHTMKRSLKQYQENCESYFDMVFPMFSVSFPLHGDPWQSDTCMDSKISADCLRYSFGGVHLPISIRPWPRQSQIKRKPDESYLLLPPHFLWTGLGYGQILLSTYGKSIGTHVAVVLTFLSQMFKFLLLLLGQSSWRPQGLGPSRHDCPSSRLLRCHCYGQKTIWIELVHTHTHLHVSLCNHHMYNSGMYQLIVIRI